MPVLLQGTQPFHSQFNCVGVQFTSVSLFFPVCKYFYLLLQVELTTDIEKREVTVKQLGTNPSNVARKFLSKNETYLLGPGGSFELLEGCYKYHVHFGQRVPESVLKKLQEEADHEDLGVDDKCEPLERLCTSESNPSPLECTPPPKKAKLDATDGVDGGLDECTEVATARISEAPIKRKQQEQKSLDVFFKGKSTGSPPSSGPTCQEKLESKWKEIETLMIFQYGPSTHSSKVAGFDLDATLVETASGKRFATGPQDWQFARRVPEKLKSLRKDGFRVVVFSNQLGILKGKPTKPDFKQKIETIAGRLQIPLLLLASTTKDLYRKPCTGMWQHLLKHENDGREVDMDLSFYVGDAAGREAKWQPGTYTYIVASFSALPTPAFISQPRTLFLHSCEINLKLEVGRTGNEAMYIVHSQSSSKCSWTIQKALLWNLS